MKKKFFSINIQQIELMKNCNPRRFSKVKILGLLLIISFQSCIDEITFDPSDQVKSQLVVDGRITTSEGPQILKLSTTQIDNLKKPSPVTDAKITIFDNFGNVEEYVQLGFNAGEYHLMNDIIKGEIGRTYFIEIELRDGSIFQSEPETLMPVPKMTNIEIDFIQETEFDITGLPKTSNFAQVLIDTPIPNEEDGVFLRWDVESDWLVLDRDDPCNPFDVPTACYFNDNIILEELRPFSSRALELNELSDWAVGRRIVDFSFQFKQYLSVYQYSLTPRAFTFFEQISALSNIEGNLFDEPPAAISGNLFNVNDPNEKVLGYFSASEVDTVRTFLVKEDIPFNFMEICQLIWPRPPCNDICYECERMDGASTIKPDFFQ